jgi:hypothetical protein
MFFIPISADVIVSIAMSSRCNVNFVIGLRINKAPERRQTLDKICLRSGAYNAGIYLWEFKTRPRRAMASVMRAGVALE